MGSLLAWVGVALRGRLFSVTVICRERRPEMTRRIVKVANPCRVILFGSAARGEMRPDSDLDVLVEFERAPSLFKYGELEDHLSDLVGMKVDLVMKRSLKPRIGRQILAEVVRL